MYSMIRETLASKASRDMLASNETGPPTRRSRVSSAGRGPARHVRTGLLASTARACAVPTSVSSSRYALARIVTVWRRWSKATITSESISAMSGRPMVSGLGSGRRSTARTQSKPKNPTAPPAKGGRPAIWAWRWLETDSVGRVYASPPAPSLQRRTSLGRYPMNEKRPTCWPCSADSSRNAGPSPRNFRNAETGVSQSSMKLWVTGTRLWSPVSASVSSSVGRTSRCSATAAKEHLLRVLEAQPAAAQQHGQVIEDVRGLLGDALVGFLTGGARHLLRFFLDLLADERRVAEETVGVRALLRVRFPFAQRALQAGQRLVGQRVRVAGEEARALAGVARGAVGLHERE